MAFRFSKPEGFVYKAGQTIDLSLVDPTETDTEGNTRTFSLASAPHEEHLMVATRMRDTAYKRVLGKMTPGGKLELEGPFGTFTLPNKSDGRHVFMMGGIGATPARSMILGATERKLPHKISLFYSNRRPEDAAFLKEFQNLANPNFTFVPTMTQMDKSSQTWTGERGYIDEAMLKKYLGELAGATFYLAGPTTMVSVMKQNLGKWGVNDDDIRLEEFAGY